MRKAVARIFLLIVLLNVAGVYFYFGVRQRQIHAMMREQLKARPRHSLTRMVFSVTDYGEMEAEGEFSWKGQMYDVAFVEKTSASTVAVYCLLDEKEGSLLRWIDEVLRQASREGNPSQAIGFSVLLMKSSPIMEWNSDVPFYRLVSATRWLASVTEFVATLYTPPPRFLS